MTEELHLRISGKGCQARLGEASFPGRLCRRVPVSLCPHVPVSQVLAAGGMMWSGCAAKGFCSTLIPPLQRIPSTSLPLHQTIALKPPEKGLELLLPLP